MALDWAETRFAGVVALQATPEPTQLPTMPQRFADTVGEEWRALVSRPEFTWDPAWALAVIACESSGNPEAYNPLGYVGLFQVSLIHRWSVEQLLDPELNTRAAHELYLRGGNPWPNCP